MNLTVILDFLITALLIATIGYAFLLNRRLMVLYKSREDLQNFIKNFSASLLKAEAGVKELKETGRNLFASIEDQTKNTKTLKDDLVFLIERGEDIAKRLDELISKSRPIFKSEQKIEAVKTLPKADEDDQNQPVILKTLKKIR
ncbi:DUF6468 domain-containing protein [Candidatus Nucleicultrix amoebiphila]|jgi:thiamine kinase-like enzyme|uniref:DUF6468 domain-containing protein n=1 Tax=Candidatus Nucleicultrix amoebiphila FS5 TaxID=1414854 RepID=A0A1W6N401_9PROT|nr:DUF6468 domain-containing protein [Candidatus Nucleicultrix amoebiphila]ARN84516.1 hypothetical protein GQ61_03355 [Candidatus Nucleicultrix amoebiphila FS5]